MSLRPPPAHGRHRGVIIALVTIFVVGASLRFGWLYVNSDSISFASLAEQNADVARNILVHDKWFVLNDASPSPTIRLIDPADRNYTWADAHPRYRQAILEPPGLPLLMAGTWAVTGSERFVYVQALQLLIDSCMILLVYWLSLRLFRRPTAALVAAAMYALYVPAILLARIPHDDAWAGWVTIGALALFVRARESTRPNGWLAAMGVLLGLGAYFRPNVLLLPIAFAAASVVWVGWRRAVRYATVPILIGALLLVPWTARNYSVFHTFVPVRTSFGWTMWVGLGEVHNDFGATGTDANAVGTVLHAHPSYVVGSPRFDKVLERKAFAAIRAHPLFYLEEVGRRLLEATILPTPTRTATSSAIAGAGAWALPLLFVLAVGSAALIVCLEPGRRWEVAVLGATAAATVVPFLVIHLEARFLVATAFVYLILTGMGAAIALDRLRQHAAERTLWWGRVRGV
jgi:4-amino-4-deoxy-L-arabinose transferase-like glycosyltransferase